MALPRHIASVSGWRGPDHWAFNMGQVVKNGWLVYAPPYSLLIGQEGVREERLRGERAEIQQQSVRSVPADSAGTSHTHTHTHRHPFTHINWAEMWLNQRNTVSFCGILFSLSAGWWEGTGGEPTWPCRPLGLRRFSVRLLRCAQWKVGVHEGASDVGVMQDEGLTQSTLELWLKHNSPVRLYSLWQINSPTLHSFYGSDAVWSFCVRLNSSMMLSGILSAMLNTVSLHVSHVKSNLQVLWAPLEDNSSAFF